MKINIAHIFEGWGKTLGFITASPAEQQMSKERLAICAKCEHVRESSLLMLVKGGADYVDSLYCKKCTCPCNEKSIVKNETCPEEFWDKI